MFSIISNDLRASVNSLQNSNATLLNKLEENDLKELNTLLHKNKALVNSSYGLLDNLLHWALLQTKQAYFDIVPLPLFIVTEQMVYNYKTIMAGKNIAFEFNVLKQDMVMADQESLKIILRNLIDNAVKYTKSGGTINIYSQTGTNNYCNLIVEDTGIGIDETTRLKLLTGNTAFHQTESKDFPDTGLGLLLCKAMIAKNKGKFSIESELGKGTKMIVSLVKV